MLNAILNAFYKQRFLNFLNFLLIVALAITLFIFLGYVLDKAQTDHGYSYCNNSFFKYRMQSLDMVPAWIFLLLVAMILIMFGVLWAGGVSLLSADIDFSDGRYGITSKVPEVTIFSIIIIVDSFSILCFIVIRQFAL
jgi:hypothetical protein